MKSLREQLQQKDTEIQSVKNQAERVIRQKFSEADIYVRERVKERFTQLKKEADKYVEQ